MRRRSSINTVSFFAFQDIITSVVGIFVLITLIMILELAQTTVASSEQAGTASAETLDKLEELERELESLERLHRNLQANAQKAARNNAFSIEEDLAALGRQLEEVDAEADAAKLRTAKLKKQLENAKQNGKQLLAKEKDLAKTQQESNSIVQQQQETAKAGAILEIEKPLIFRDRTEQGRFLVLVILEKKWIQVSEARNGKTQSYTRSDRISQFGSWLKQVEVSEHQFLLIVKPSGEPDFEAVRKSLVNAHAVYGFDVAAEDQKFRLRSQLGAL